MANELKMPQLGLTMEEGTVTEWLKAEGDAVRIGEALVEITTDKITNEIASEWDGVLLKIAVPEGETVPVQSVLAYIGSAGETVGISAAPESAVASEAVAPLPVPAASTERVRISPLARKTAQKLGVCFSGLNGSGPAGRIVQKDILLAAEKKKPVEASRPADSAYAEDAVTKLSGMRKVVAERMLRSHTEIPSVTQTVKVDVTELMALRAKLRDDCGEKFSVNDFVLRAAAMALREIPHILVSFSDGSVISHSRVNIGMAVALDAGLIVPVIKDADKLGLRAISERAADLALRARNGGLTMDEYQGSTFSVSNLGMFGVESFTPIINQPNAAILGVCAIDKELRLDDAGSVEQRSVMRLSLTYDHRLMDGAVAAKFELAIKNILEAPLKMLL